MSTQVFSVVIRGCGFAGLPLAAKALGAGHRVTVVAEDMHEARRLQDLMRRGPAPGGHVRIQIEGDPLAAVDFAIAPEALMPTAAPFQLCLGDPPEGETRGDGHVAFHPHPDCAEIVWGQAETSAQLAITGFLQDIGLPVLWSARHAKRFAGLFLKERFNALADHVLILGAVPWEVDDALEQIGFAEGVFKGQDREGLGPVRAAAPLLIRDRMIQEGRLGRSVGVGWYRYPGNGGAVIDPLLEDMIVEEARFGGLSQTALTAKAVQDLLMLGLASVATEMLQQQEIPDRAAFQNLAVRLLGAPDIQVYLGKMDPESWLKAAEMRHPYWNAARLEDWLDH